MASQNISSYNKFAIYFGGFMALFYFVAAVCLFCAVGGLAKIPHDSRILFASLLVSYSVFRAFRVYRNFNRQYKKQDDGD